VRRAIVRRLGFKSRPPRSPWLDETFALGRIVSLRPDVVLDIGANEGQFVERLRARGYLGRVISFEPQAKAHAALCERASKDANWECHHLALGDSAGTLPMHVSAFSLSSSLLPIGKLHVDLMPQTAEIGTEEVPVIRLDQWPGCAGLESRRVFVKLDVQGYELPVLRGMGLLLAKVEGALVELNFCPLFDGQSQYYEVIGQLESAGLRLAGLTAVNLHPSTSDYLWGDGLFLRSRRADG
jgi:FkbM family methyltransferase